MSLSSPNFTRFVPKATKKGPIASGATFGQRLGQARRELGVREWRDINPTDLAAMLDVSVKTVRRWESDEPGKMPRDETLLRLADVLGVAPGWLRYGQQPKYVETADAEVLPEPGTAVTKRPKSI